MAPLSQGDRWSPHHSFVHPPSCLRELLPPQSALTQWAWRKAGEGKGREAKLSFPSPSPHDLAVWRGRWKLFQPQHCTQTPSLRPAKPRKHLCRFSSRRLTLPSHHPLPSPVLDGSQRSSTHADCLRSTSYLQYHQFQGSAEMPAKVSRDLHHLPPT